MNTHKYSWYTRAVAYNIHRDRVLVEADNLRRAIEELCDDLDKARSYVQIHARLRAALGAINGGI